MIRIFEHRSYDPALARQGRWAVGDVVIRAFHGEDQRALAYSTCARENVVVEREVVDAV